MRRFLYQSLFIRIILFLLFSNVFAEGLQQDVSRSKTIPPGLKSLVQQGFTLESPQTQKVITGGGVPKGGNAIGNVSFGLVKKVNRPFPVDKITYRFELNIMENPEALVKIQAQHYRNGLEKDIKDQLANCRSRTETNDLSAVVTYDTPKLTRYPWGAGITQKATHKFLNDGNPNQIVYECFYHGLIIDKRSIKLLKFSASGVSAPQEADAWAVMAAEKSEQISISNL